MKRVGILTGGGDVPGLNPCIKAVVNRVADSGGEVVGIRRGWGGLLNCNPDDPESLAEHTLTLDKQVVRKIDRTGGTWLHSSRTNPSRVSDATVPDFLADQVSGDGPHDLTPHALKVVEALEIDALIPIGGDDTLSYGLRMHDEGVPVIAVPKTMDNDVRGTEYCIGFSTAVTRSVQFINNLRTSTGSHERIAVVELFGRYSGATSLISSYLAGADRALISEVPFDIDKLCDFVLADKAANPSNYAIITVSEGATIEGGELHLSGEEDAFGHRKLGGIGRTTGDLIKEKTGEGIILQEVAYLMRSGPPDSLDLMVGTNYGTMAADLALEGTSGHMVALNGGTYQHVPIGVTGGGFRAVDVDELYDVDQYRAKVRSMGGKPMFLY
jgi:6-phosphofructokinase 1